jgi:hypothetical protein
MHRLRATRPWTWYAGRFLPAIGTRLRRPHWLTDTLKTSVEMNALKTSKLVMVEPPCRRFRAMQRSMKKPQRSMQRSKASARVLGDGEYQRQMIWKVARTWVVNTAAKPVFQSLRIDQAPRRALSKTKGVRSSRRTRRAPNKSVGRIVAVTHPVSRGSSNTQDSDLGANQKRRSSLRGHAADFR